MESVALNAPAGIGALLGCDPSMTEHDRKRQLARELVATRLGVDRKRVRVEREAPSNFGFHTQLIPEVDGVDVPMEIRNVSFREATVVAVADPAMPIGIDLRDPQPDEVTMGDIRRHSKLLDQSDVPALLTHWTRVQAVRAADGRGARVSPERVRFNAGLTRGWVRDRHFHYDVVDLSRDGWVITLAYAADPS